MSRRASQAEWFFTKVKVALALAIIKTKPPGMSGREHAEDLARRLKARDGSWEEAARGLQQEVLRLRQELLIVRVTSGMKSSTEAAGPDDLMDASQDLFGPGSEVYSADLQPGCGSETPELLLVQDSQPAITLPEPPVPFGPRGAKPVIPHVQFLQSLCALQRVEDNGRGLEALWFSPEGGTESVLADSVCQLLDSVVAASRDPPPLGAGELVLQACRVAARAMDLICSQRQPSAELTGRVEESLTELTALLLHSNQLSRLRSAEQLMEHLITLGSSSMSTAFLIRHILSLISALADQLLQFHKGQESSALEEFPLDPYQNSSYLFWIVEELLQRSEVPCRVEVGSDQTGFLRHLERSVFLLSEDFPLFFICMWRVGFLLTSSSDRREPPEPGAGPPPPAPL